MMIDNINRIQTWNVCLIWLVCSMLLCAEGAYAQPKGSGHTTFLYVGTYARAGGEGIYLYAFDIDTGRLEAKGLAAKMDNPSFLVTDPHHRFLYAVKEVGNDGLSHGSISSFAIDRETGGLRFLNAVDSQGGGPCHLAVDRAGRYLFAANYGSGSIAAFALAADGSIGELTGFDQHSGSSVDPVRQKSPHAHAVGVSPDNKFLLATDLGTDQLFVYRINAVEASLRANDPPFARVLAGSGPRHFVFGLHGKTVYLLCEMGSSVVTFSFDRKRGRLLPLQTISTLSPEFSGTDNSAEIAIDHAGRFLYVSNRGEDTIAVFSISRGDGTLSRIQSVSSGGATPRNFVLDPTGRFLLVLDQNANYATVFKINHNDGMLQPIHEQAEIPGPVSALFIGSRD